MEPTFTLSIEPNGLSTITHNGNEDTVVQVQYKLSATDGTHSHEIRGAVQLKPSEDGAFIDFAALTEAQVLAWVQAAIRPEDMNHYKMGLTRVLQMKANPPARPVVKAAPWNTCSPSQ